MKIWRSENVIKNHEKIIKNVVKEGIVDLKMLWNEKHDEKILSQPKM